jgi:hypothetical protein
MSRVDGRRSVRDPVYLIGRHGIAHAFVAKPRILVTRLSNAERHHLRLAHGTADTLIIDAPTLARDFRRAYRNWRAKLKVDSAFRALCEARVLDVEVEARGQSTNQANALRKTPPATVPLPQPRVPQGLRRRTGWRRDFIDQHYSIGLTVCQVCEAVLYRLHALGHR